jgi:hypothetical protein
MSCSLVATAALVMALTKLPRREPRSTRVT